MPTVPSFTCRWPAMRRRCLTPLAALSLCLLGAISGAMAQQPRGPGEIGWLGLYENALIGWLENENRLQELCAGAPANTPAQSACRAEKMKPMQLMIELRSAPQDAAPSAGTLRIVATPGLGLRALYRPAQGGAETEFTPDLYDIDWGYGPYFHQTFVERRGPWFLLPAGPFPGPVWVKASAYAGEPIVRQLEVGEIIKMAGSDLVVLGIEPRWIRARPEQSADLWCKEGNPPPLQPAKEITIPVEKLYGPTGHLLIDIKYKRGC